MPIPIICSARNPRVRSALELRDRRQRERAGRTLIYGAREITRALDAGVAPVELFVAPTARDSQAPLVERAHERGASIIAVAEPVIERLTYGDRSDGIVAVAPVPATTLAALSLPDDPLLVVLEGVEKPGNLGAVLRSADAAGASAVIAADARTDLFNPNAIRASVGTVFSVPVAAAPSSEVLGWLRRAGARIVAARVDARDPYTDLDLRGPLAIVLGSEAAGLSGAWDAPDVTGARLPMLGIADSLNVSIAAAVLLFEARRQRGPAPTRHVTATGRRLDPGV
jgi:TrmH family RNA methyltransferase